MDIFAKPALTGGFCFFRGYYFPRANTHVHVLNTDGFGLYFVALRVNVLYLITHLFSSTMTIKSLIVASLLGLASHLAHAQVSPAVSSQPKLTNPNLKVDPKLRVSVAAQTLTGGSRKAWKLTGMTTNGYGRSVDAGSCYGDNVLTLSNDQNANYSEGAKVCSMSVGQLSLQWQVSADGKKLTLTGIPAMTTDNKNAIVGFLLGNESEILELSDTKLLLKFKATDGYINGAWNYVTNELTYTAQ